MCNLRSSILGTLIENSYFCAANIGGKSGRIRNYYSALLGYTQWRNFLPAIEKAKSACQNAGEDIAYHFADVRKMVSVGSGAERQYGQNPIEEEHVDNNLAVRDMLVSRGIYPEQLPAGEDVKKVERRLRTKEKKITVKKKI